MPHNVGCVIVKMPHHHGFHAVTSLCLPLTHAHTHTQYTQAEKQMVKSISKLKSQREKIREFQGAQDGLAQMEAEAKKLKAVIDEVREGELDLLDKPPRVCVVDGCHGE